MPKKNIKGKGNNKDNINKVSRELILKDDNHEYGIITKKLGGGRFMVKLNLRNKEIIGRICGKLRHGISKKSNWIEVDCIVLVGFRDFQDNTVDIVHKYEPNEVKQLRKSGEILLEENIKSDNPNLDTENNDDIGFDFDDL
jgi:translation initiation factor 1A